MNKEIDALIKGYKKFHQENYKTANPEFIDLVEHGQKPKILMIACCDSRVDPALLMNCQPGDLFVVRNVANLIPPNEPDNQYHGTSAAIEFAVKGLLVKNIIILGHAQCGGIRSLVEKGTQSNVKQSDFIEKWMEIAQPALDLVEKHSKDQTLDIKAHLCEQHSLIYSRKNLLSFPWVKTKVENGELKIHLWYFDLDKGKLLSYSDEEESFTKLT